MKLPKLRFDEILMLTIAALLPLQLYRINLGGLNWSLDRVLLIPAIILIILRIFKHFNDHLFALVCGTAFLVAAIVSYLGVPADYNEFYVKYFPSLVQCVILYIGFSVFTKDNPSFIAAFNKVVFVWVALLSIFCIQAIYYYYIEKSLLYTPFFLEYFPGADDLVNHSHKIGQMNSRRMFWPFGTSPHLSFALGICALFFVYYYLLKRTFVYLIGMAVLISFLVLCLSRSGVVSFLIGFLMLFVFTRRNDILKFNKVLLFAMIMGILSIPIYYIVINTTSSEAVDRLTRLTTDDASIEAHLYIRLKLFDAYIHSGPAQLLTGNGLGISEAVFASYGHMSYVTVLYEMGMLGFISFCLMQTVPLYNCLMKIKSTPSEICAGQYFIALSMGMLIFFSHALYEAKTFPFFAVVTGFIYGISKSQNNSLVAADMAMRGK